MSRQLALFAAIALGAAAAAGAQPRTQELEAVKGLGAVDRKTQTDDVKFRNDASDRMTVPVRLSGSGPYRFLVDTGADRTAISHQLAAQLQLQPRGTVALHSVTGASQVRMAAVPSLQLSRKEMKGLSAPLLDAGDMGADGIIGVDALRSERVTFDFDAKLLSIVPSASADFRDEPGTIVVEAKRRNGRLILTEAKVNGKRLSVVIDTGSEVSVGNAALRHMLLRGHLVGPEAQVELISVTGDKLRGDSMFVRELHIGGVGLRNLGIVFADVHTFKQLKLEGKPALLLGMNAMRAFKKVSIDFANKKLRVVVPERSEIQVRMAGAKPVPTHGIVHSMRR